jgi:hypothetical protein
VEGFFAFMKLMAQFSKIGNHESSFYYDKKSRYFSLLGTSKLKTMYIVVLSVCLEKIVYTYAKTIIDSGAGM